MIEEVWVGIEPHPDYLEISNFGRVKRLESNTLKWNYSKLGKAFLHNTKVTEKILKGNISRCGYRKVITQVNGEKFTIVIHREVAKAFVPNPENKPCVNHIDSDKLNNSVSNLEWVTYKENNEHYQTSRKHDKSGKVSDRFSGSVDAYDYETGEFVCKMFGNKDMKEKGFDFRLVSAVLKGKRRKHNNCYFIKNDDVLSKNFQVEQFSKSSFKPLEVYDKNNILVFTLEKYEDIIKHKLTPQRVSDCITGKARQHKGFIFKFKQEEI